MKINPKFEALIPVLPAEVFQTLKDDIEANGQRDPILVDEDGDILDGHHRFKILGKDAKSKCVKIPKEEREAFCIKVNLNRRNLTRDELNPIRKRQQEIALEWKKAGWTQERIGKVLGVKQNTISDWLGMPIIAADNGHTPEPSDPPAPPPASTDCRVKLSKAQKEKIVERVLGNGESQEQVASDYGINQGTVSRLVTEAKVNSKAEEKRKSELKQVSLSTFEEGLAMMFLMAGCLWEYAERVWQAVKSKVAAWVDRTMP